MWPWLGRALVGLGLLSSPLASTGLCPSGLVATHVAHEWGHDLGAWVEGLRPPNPGLLVGDKWDDAGARRVRPVRAGLVAQTWLAAATLDPCVAHGNAALQAIYALRASFEGRDGRLDQLHGRLGLTAGDFDRLGDYRSITPAHRAAFGAIAVGTAVILEAISDDWSHTQEWP